MTESPRTPSGGELPGAEALELLARYLEGDGWQPRRLPGSDSFVMSFRGARATFSCQAALRVDAEQLLCYALAPARVPEQRRAAMAEFLTRANAGLYVGNFELSYATGEVRAKVGLDFEGQPLSPRLIRNAMLLVVRLMDTYIAGIASVAAGAEPRAAIAQIEAAP